MGGNEVGSDMGSVSESVPEGSSRIIWEDEEPDRKGLWPWIGLTCFLIVLFVGSFFVFPGDSAVEISNEEVEMGKSINFEENSLVSIEVDGEEYEVEVEIAQDSVKVGSGDSALTINMKIGESGDLDLDGDGDYDLSVKFEVMDGGEFKLFFERFVVNVLNDGIVGEVAEEITNLSLDDKVDNDTVLIINNASGDEGSSCSELGGYICSSDEKCKGMIYDDVLDSDFCCNIMCTVKDGIVDENLSAEDICNEKGWYLYSDGDFCGGTLAKYYIYDVPVSCCSVPVSDSPEFSSELRSVWDSIPSSGNCSQSYYILKLSSCSPYKCDYVHPVFDVEVEKGIIGEYGEKCHSLEELPNDGEMHCNYNDSQLVDMVEYLTFVEEQCGDGNCSMSYNESGSFVNGILVDNVLLGMMASGDCVSSYG